MRDFFFLMSQQRFFCFQVSFCPVKRGNRAGSPRNESEYWERYPDQFSASRESQLREFQTSSVFNCVERKLTLGQKGGSDELLFSSNKIEK